MSLFKVWHVANQNGFPVVQDDALLIDHKTLVAQSLRKGLAIIKAQYRQLLADNVLYEQWAFLSLYNHGMQWDHHEIDHDFAVQSKQLLKRIKRSR